MAISREKSAEIKLIRKEFADKAFTIRDVADLLKFTMHGARDYTNLLHGKLKETYIADTIQTKRGLLSPVYRFGKGVDAEMDSVKIVINLIRAEPRTISQICEATGYSRATVHYAMKKSNQTFHVVDWLRTKGGTSYAAKYALGDGPNMPRPAPLPREVSMQRYDAKLRKPGEMRDKYLKRKRKEYYLRKVLVEPQHVLPMAFFRKSDAESHST